MRICFYAPMKPPDHPVPSGDRRMARLMMAALRCGGHDVRLASRFRSYEGRGDRARQLEIEAEAATERAHLNDLWATAPKSAQPEAWFTYHLYYKAPDHLGPKLAAAHDLPYYVAEASYAPKRAGGPWNRGHQATAEAISAARVVFSMTQLDTACLRPLVHSPNKLANLPPFIDGTDFAKRSGEDARQQLAEDLDLKPDDIWLLCVAMMRTGDKLASYRQLAEAVAALRTPNWSLLIVGDGAGAEDVRAAFEPFKDRVHFLGRQSAAALPKFYQACDIYVWPAVGEAYGMAFLEAQAGGLPVVAGNHRGVPDVVVDNRTGLLARPDDPRDLAAQIDHLAANPTLRQSMGRGASKFVLTERTVAKTAARINKAIGCPIG